MSKHTRYEADRTKAIRWIVDSLGGTTRTAALMGMKSQAVNNWFVRGLIPATSVPPLLKVWAEQVSAGTLREVDAPMQVADITRKITRDVIERPGIKHERIPVPEKTDKPRPKKAGGAITEAMLNLDVPAGNLVDSIVIPVSNKLPTPYALKRSVNGSMMHIRKTYDETFTVEWQDTPTGLLVWRTK